MDLASGLRTQTAGFRLSHGAPKIILDKSFQFVYSISINLTEVIDMRTPTEVQPTPEDENTATIVGED